MKHEQWTVAALAEAVGGQLEGPGEAIVSGLAALDDAGPQHIAYAKGRRFREALQACRAAAVLVPESEVPFCPVTAIVVDDPYAAYARAGQLLHPPPAPRPGIHPSAIVEADAEVDASAEIGPRVVVGAGARVGAGCIIGPGTVIEPGARVGEGSRLGPGVVLGRDCRIGRRCIVHGGVVIGADGFGFAPSGGRWEKIPQIGAVRIGDDCEIGANSCIDRGALHDTVIGNGVKIDNLVQIGHNVRIGDHSIIVACAMIGGSTRIGSGCAIAGGVGLAGHLELADGTQVTGMSMVAHDLPAGRYSSAIEVQDSRTWRRNHARLHRLDETIKKLRREIEALERKIDEE